MTVDVSMCGIVVRTSPWESEILPTLPPETKPSSPTPIPTTIPPGSRSTNSERGRLAASHGPTTSTDTPTNVPDVGSWVPPRFHWARGEFFGKAMIEGIDPAGIRVLPEGWKKTILVSEQDIVGLSHDVSR
jgi:hypothetical protein